MNMELNQSLLKDALSIYAERLAESLPTKEECAHITFSPGFEKRMKRMIREHQKFYYFWFNTIAKRVASAVLLVILGLAVTTFGVKAWRESLIDFVIKSYERFTEIDVTVEDVFQHVVNRVEPTYIPNGFVVEKRNGSSVNYKVIYKRNDGELLTFSQNLISSDKGIDTEDGEYRTVIINGYDGILNNKNGYTMIVFCSDEYMFTIFGSVGEEELLQMAKSIPVKE